ncbi:hypothetical protein EG68_05639 [Paragonimus skrjabini miyazakii]|uniref:Uncharacterized protein n=1 Tax=Paragonimus skrjabini miyazakii TaxID=59628 RepID=A0A8S9Z950_9TREM|nr:hypothetical protein EG68_05639 [Paragonimus skrjabini miyazakii]
MCMMYRRYEECCATPLVIISPGLLLRSYHRAKHGIETNKILLRSFFEADVFVELFFKCVWSEARIRLLQTILTPIPTVNPFPNYPLQLQGTLFRDCVYDYCCPMCAACQLDRDMKYVESTKGVLNV